MDHKWSTPKKYFPGNKKTSPVHSQRMLKSVRSPRVSAYSIGLLCNPKKPGACISVFSLPEGESFCIGTFGRLWNGLRSVPPCRRNCSFATGNAKRAETKVSALYGGELGIWTLETLITPTRFPIVRLRPLSQLSILLSCCRFWWLIADDLFSI